MDKIYQQAKDCHVVATVIYNNGSDEYAYVDAECTTKIKTSDLKEAFIKGVLLDVNGVLIEPVNFGVNKEGNGCVTCFPSVEGTLSVLLAEPDEVVEELVSDY